MRTAISLFKTVSTVESVKAQVGAKTGNLNGRAITPMAYYLLLAGASIGTVAVVVAYIFAQHAILVTSALLAITNGFGAVAIKRMKITKEIEDTIDDLNGRIEIITGENTKLKENSDKIQKEAEELRKIVEDYKAAEAEDEKEIEGSTKQIGTLTDKIKVADDHLEKLNSIYDPLKATVAKFVEAGSSIVTGNKELDLSITELISTLKSSHEAIDHLEEQEQAMDAKIKLIHQWFDQITTLIPLMQKACAAMHEENEKRKVQNQESAANVRKFEQLKAELSKEIEELKEREKQSKLVMQALAEFLPDPAILKQRIDALKRKNAELLGT